jgi:hypothetical protein
MAISNNAFWQYKETRALSGYKSAWLVKNPDDTSGKFSLIGATESVPYVFGEKGSFEFNLLQADGIGKVEDKMSLEAVSVDVLHHRDNAYRFNKLKGKTLEFMSINAELMGYKFVGTLDYKPNTAEADVNRATVTITPMSAETTPVYNARNEVIETLCFLASIPEKIKVADTINLSVVQSDVTPTVKAVKIEDGTNKESDATASLDISDITKVKISTAGLYAITVSATGYAPWTTTVYVEA